MNAIFGITSKTMNSTWRQMSDKVTLNVKLKDPCTRHNPVFKVQGLNKTKRYNYCEWMSSWYFIDDIVYLTNDIQEVHCRLDPMATFRDAIAGVEAMCVYADEANWDEKLDDLRFSADHCIMAGSAGQEAFLDSVTGGGWEWTDAYKSTVILDVIQTTSTGQGAGFHKWAMTLAQYAATMYDLDENTLDAAIGLFKGSGSFSNLLTQAGQDLASIVGSMGGGASWQECIIKATWIPVSINVFTSSYYSTQANEIYIGTVKIEAGQTPGGSQAHFYEITSPAFIKSSHQQITHAEVYGTSSLAVDLQFLRNPRWTCLNVRTPGGTQIVDDPIIREDAAWPLQLITEVDCLTGRWNMMLNVKNNLGAAYIKDGKTLARFSGCCGVDLTQWLSNKGNGLTITMGAMSKIIPAIMTQGASTVVDSVITNDISTEAVGEGDYKISQKTDKTVTNTHSVTTGKKTTPMPTCSTGGASFSAAANSLEDYYFVDDGSGVNKPMLGCLILAYVWGPRSFIDDADPYEAYKDYCDIYGYPCNKFLAIGDIADKAYVRCTDAQLMYCAGATTEDLKTINFFLNDGFIWERIET